MSCCCEKVAVKVFEYMKTKAKSQEKETPKLTSTQGKKIVETNENENWEKREF